ncbi:MAG: lamin tail domain-containing protein [Chthoniobacter sp.]
MDDQVVEGPETVTLTLGDTGSYDVGSPATATVTIADDANQVPAGSIVITEVAPWSSGNSSLGVDWFEVTNIGTATVNTTGWRMDDNSNSFAASVPMTGVTSIAPGESVIFMETADLAGLSAAFRSLWFGGNPPAGLQFGAYSGSGVGLSTGGDAVNLFDSAGNVITGVTFGAAPASAPFATFENKARLGSTTLPGPFFSALSTSGANGAFAANGDTAEIGSPGTASSGLIAPAGSGPIDLAAAPRCSCGQQLLRPRRHRAARSKPRRSHPRRPDHHLHLPRPLRPAQHHLPDHRAPGSPHPARLGLGRPLHRPLPRRLPCPPPASRGAIGRPTSAARASRWIGHPGGMQRH